MGYFDWHEQPGYFRDVTRHFAADAEILDVGCGSAWLADHFANYTGVDGAPEAVAAAHERGRAATLVRRRGATAVRGRELRRRRPQGPARAPRRPRRRSCARCAACCGPGGRVFASSPDAQRWVWDDYTHVRPFTRKSFRLLFARPGLRGRAGRLRVGRCPAPAWSPATRGASGARCCSRCWHGCRSCGATSGCWRRARVSVISRLRRDRPLRPRRASSRSTARAACARYQLERRAPQRRAALDRLDERAPRSAPGRRRRRRSRSRPARSARWRRCRARDDHRRRSARDRLDHHQPVALAQRGQQQAGRRRDRRPDLARPARGPAARPRRRGPARRRARAPRSRSGPSPKIDAAQLRQRRRARGDRRRARA